MSCLGQMAKCPLQQLSRCLEPTAMPTGLEGVRSGEQLKPFGSMTGLPLHVSVMRGIYRGQSLPSQTEPINEAPWDYQESLADYSGSFACSVIIEGGPFACVLED